MFTGRIKCQKLVLWKNHAGTWDSEQNTVFTLGTPMNLPAFLLQRFWEWGKSLIYDWM